MMEKLAAVTGVVCYDIVAYEQFVSSRQACATGSTASLSARGMPGAPDLFSARHPVTATQARSAWLWHSSAAIDAALFLSAGHNLALSLLWHDNGVRAHGAWAGPGCCSY